jgi:hypothetical protein
MAGNGGLDARETHGRVTRRNPFPLLEIDAHVSPRILAEPALSHEEDFSTMFTELIFTAIKF